MPGPKQVTEKKPVKRTTLQGQPVADAEKRAQKQPGQALAPDKAGGPAKSQTNHNRPSERS
jgi:hypothetical protein